MNAPHNPAPSGAQRVFDHQRIWHLDETVFIHAAKLLAAHEAHYLPDAVVGVVRGGVPLAHALGRYLGIDVLEIYARHNTSDAPYVQATGDVQLRQLAEPFIQLCSGRRLLVADDICGSGATLRAVCELMESEVVPASLRSVALCRNVGAAETPDAWLWDTRDWVLFPWDEPAEPAEPVAVPVEPLTTPDRVRTKESR